MEDGSVITTDFSSDGKPLNYWDAHGKLIWSKPIIASHAINLCKEKKAIVVITSEEKKIKNNLVRADGVAIFDLSGKNLHSWHIFDHYEELDPIMKFQNLSLPLDTRGHLRSKAMNEITHFNAVYEIPENKNPTKNRAFSKGNFLVTPYGQHFFILSADLKDILWISKNKYFAHDARVLENGNLLFFQNHELTFDYEGKTFEFNLADEWKSLNKCFTKGLECVDSQKERKTKTQGLNASFIGKLLEVDPSNESVIWSYQGSPKLYAPVFGSLSLWKEYYVFTGSPDINQIKIINRQGKEISSFSCGPNGPRFRVQFLEHTGFLKNQM